MTDIEKAVNIIKKEAERQNQVNLNRIASALKTDYVDFMSAIDEPMTVELGECLRLQMAEIFKILQKNGVDIESRIH